MTDGIVNYVQSPPRVSSRNHLEPILNSPKDYQIVENRYRNVPSQRDQGGKSDDLSHLVGG